MPPTAASPTRFVPSRSPPTRAERQFLPAASTLNDRLLLADRGYPGVDYFEAVDKEHGSFIVRLTRSHDPWVRAAWVDGKRIPLPKPIRLSRLIAQNLNRRMDLDVEYERDNGKRLVALRVVVLPGNDKTMTRLCTNLPRTPFSLDLVSRLYRFRWQVELLFKEWKSYANLHKFDTANEHIAAGLIWASLCAGAQAIPGPRGSARQRQADLHAPCRHVRRPYHRRDRCVAPRLCEHRGRLWRRDGVLARQRAALEPAARSKTRTTASRPACRRSSPLRDHL